MRIPSAVFKSKILCRRHNNALSPADAEIGRFVTTFKTFFENRDAFGKTPSRFTKLPIRYSLNGPRLERWFCKTLINLVIVNETDAEARVPEILPHLFLDRPFSRPLGLSFAVKTGMSGDWNTSGIEIAPLFDFHEGRRLLFGGLVIFRSFRFVVLLPGPVDPIRNGTLPLSEQQRDWEGLQLNWHNREISESVKLGPMNTLFQVISIDWD